MKKILIYLSIILLTSQNSFSQTVVNLVINGTKSIKFSAAQGWETGNWGADPVNFGDGCGDSQHNWSTTKKRGYLSTNLKPLFYVGNGNPDNTTQSIEIINGAIEVGTYEISDNYYENKYSAQRNRKCQLCRCETSQCCETDFGASNAQVKNRWILNVEISPEFNNIYRYNSTINQFTVCSSDSSFLLSKLVDKIGSGNAFFDKYGDKDVLKLFNPSLYKPKNQKDTILEYTYIKNYDNGGITKKFSIKVIANAGISTLNNEMSYSLCQNEKAINIVDVVKANPTAGVYYYNNKPIEIVNPKDYSTSNIDITYKVTVGLCESQKTVALIFKTAPVIKNISTIGTFCNNSKNIVLKLDNTYNTDGKKAGIVRGTGVKTFPIETLAPKINANYVPDKYDSLQLKNLTEGDVTLYYDLKDLTTNCISTDTFSVTIKSPAVISTNNSKICKEVLFYSMSKDVLPKGGVYSTNFNSYLANDSTLNISKIPLGKLIVKYTYTTQYGCTSTSNIEYDILERPTIFNMPSDTTFCDNSKEKKYVALPSFGIWSGLGIAPDGTFNPKSVQSDQQIKLTYTTTIGICSDTKYMYATILKSPNSPEIIGAKSEYCTGDSVKLYATVQGSTGLKFNWYLNENIKPITNGTNYNFIADKNLKRVICETVNNKGCVSITNTEKRFTLNLVNVYTRIGEVIGDTLIKKGESIAMSVFITGDVILSAVWNFGDKTSGIGQKVAHYMYDTGTYAMNVKVLTEKGCEITAIGDKKIKVLPIQEFNNTNSSETNAKGEFITDENYLRIFPNPTENGLLNLFIYKDEASVELTIYDIYGNIIQIINMPQLTSSTLDLSNNLTKSGTYLLKIKSKTPQKESIYKIVKL